jgi:ankyrin repeat protein
MLKNVIKLRCFSNFLIEECKHKDSSAMFLIYSSLGLSEFFTRWFAYSPPDNELTKYATYKMFWLISKYSNWFSDKKFLSEALMLKISNFGKLNTIRFLLRNGADVEYKGTDGRSALVVAARKDRDDFMKLFICTLVYDYSNRGVLSNDLEVESVQLAFKITSKPEIYELLINSGYKFQQNDLDEVLIKASLNGHESAVRALISAKADVNYVDSERNTALIHAARMSYPEVVELLLASKSDVDFKTNNNKTPLEEAVAADDFEIVQQLINGKANLESQDRKRRSVLIQACRQNSFEIVELLIEARADLEYKYIYEHTALIKASRRGHYEVVEALIKGKADLENTDNGRWTALIHSVDRKRFEVTQLLINSKANINHTGFHGDTAMSFALFHRQFGAVKRLIFNGADYPEVSESSPDSKRIKRIIESYEKSKK